MTEALSAQTQQINELTEYFHTKSEIDKQIVNIESMELVMARPVNQTIMIESYKNTSLAAKGALANRLQRRTACKI